MANYKFYRINISDFMRSGSVVNFACISEIYLYDADGNDVSKNEGCVYTASSSYNSANGPANAFDRNINTLWHSLTNGCAQWICIEFVEQTQVESFGIMPRSDGWTDYINSFTFEGSNDGQAWEVLLEQTGIYSGWAQGTERKFELVESSTANYNSVAEIVAGVENATQLVSNTKYDDNSYSISAVPDFVRYKGNELYYMYANGNSYIGFGTNEEHFKYNRRDAAMYNLWKEEGTYLDKYRFFRIRWNGMCKYNAAGDPYRQTFDLLIFDTGDVMFYAVDIPTQYYDGTFAFADVEYNAPTTDARYTTFYAQADGTYRTVYAPIEFAQPYATKYFVRDGSTLYTVTDGTLSVVEGDLTADLFVASGVDVIPDGTLLLPLDAPEVLCWTDGEELPTLTATVHGNAAGKHEIVSDDINVGHDSITGVKSLVVVADDGAEFYLSFDGGEWMVYDASNGTWVESSVGMSATDFAAVSTDVWNNVKSSVENMRLKAVIEGTETVTQVKFTFDNATA